jgi:hypothetical protein
VILEFLQHVFHVPHCATTQVVTQGHDPYSLARHDSDHDTLNGLHHEADHD